MKDSGNDSPKEELHDPQEAVEKIIPQEFLDPENINFSAEDLRIAEGLVVGGLIVEEADGFHSRIAQLISGLAKYFGISTQSEELLQEIIQQMKSGRKITNPSYAFALHLEQILDKDGLQEQLDEYNDIRKKFELLDRYSQNFFWVWDIDTLSFEHCSQSCESLLGFTVDEMMQKNVIEMVPKEKLEEFTQMVINSAHLIDTNNEKEFVFELEQVKKDGTTFQAEVTTTIYYNDEGIPIKALGITRDITELSHNKQQLVTKNEQLETVFDSAPSMMFLIDEDRRIIKANHRMTRATGLSEGELLGMLPGDAFGCENSFNEAGGCGFDSSCKNCSLIMAARDTLKTNKGYHRQEGQITVRTEEGEQTIHVLFTMSQLTLSGEKSVLVCLEDVSQFKALEEEQRKSVQTLREHKEIREAITQSMADGMLVVGAKGEVIFRNDFFKDIWSIPKDIDAIDDRALLNYIRDQLESPEDFLTEIRRLYRSHEPSDDILKFKDGKIVEMHSKPLILNGELTGRVWTFRDITQKVALEEALQQTNKLEALGSLAGGIAHDFNNKLSGIMSLSNAGKMIVHSDHPTYELFEYILGSSEKAAELIRQLLAFARKEPQNAIVTNIGKSIFPGLKNVLQHTLRENISVSYDIDPDLHKINVDPAALESVLINLSTNAQDAMPNGGELSISATNVEFNSDIDIIKPGKYVRITIEDNGTGIDDDTLKRIFEPFFTTKEVGKGTGLGLSQAYGMIKQSNGEITVNSTLGQGTVVTILLPKQEEDSEETSEKTMDPIVEISPKHGTILFVEDDEGVRFATNLLLKKMGHTVLAFDSPQDVIQIATDSKQNFDILISDIVMPQMDGRELARRIEEIYPGIKVLLVSGYFDQFADTDADTAARVDNYNFLGKPFELEELQQAIQTMLNSTPSAPSEEDPAPSE